MRPTIVLYTHTDVKDVWPPFFGQTKKWLSEFNKVIFINDDDITIPSDYTKIFYNDNKIYRNRLLDCIEQISDELILFHHEDMFLYEAPNIDKIEVYSDYLLKSEQSFIKLIRGGNQVGASDKIYPELKQINKSFEYIFAIQPVIWKRDKLLEIIRNSAGDTIWQFELEAQQVCRDRNIYGYYVDDGGIRRGVRDTFHWDSKVYPYVATAVVKGKWNTEEYPNELQRIAREYNVSLKDRGTNEKIEKQMIRTVINFFSRAYRLIHDALVRKSDDVTVNNRYTKMQKQVYSDGTTDHEEHNANNDYWTILLGGLSDVDLSDKLALDFGCGKGRNVRNLINHANFLRVDGVDLSITNIEHCKSVMKNSKFFTNNGIDLQNMESDTYDFIMSTIVLQHIPVYDIRLSLLKEIFRILKGNGQFRFQMGYGNDLINKNGINRRAYYENYYAAEGTNGTIDVRITDENDLINDCKDVGFTNIEIEIRDSFSDDGHLQWIYATCKKEVVELN